LQVEKTDAALRAANTPTKPPSGEALPVLGSGTDHSYMSILGARPLPPDDRQRSCVGRSWYRNRATAAEHLSPRGGYPDMLDKFRQVSSALHIGPVNSAMNNGMTNAYGFQTSEENGAGR
jgi:hypothetical protein